MRKFKVRADLRLVDGAVPLTWWTYAPNVGDLLSPYIVERLTGLPVTLVDNYPNELGLRRSVVRRLSPRNRFSYLAVGSIVNRAHDASVVWGSGAFGTETRRVLNPRAKYLAVRGPMTRNKLRVVGIDCPAIYGDPGLLLPLVFDPAPMQRYRLGIVLRHSEEAALGPGLEGDVRLISMRSNDVEGTITEMLSCERIVAASLHGLVVADAYGIPSAWLASDTPKGLDFKYYDYMLAVDKVREPQRLDMTVPLTRTHVEALAYDDRPINFDCDRLLEASPFVEP
ncbi:MAG: polysaccharide pyruvyl transferase family protein [Chloroflexota bacterium]